MALDSSNNISSNSFSNMSSSNSKRVKRMPRSLKNVVTSPDRRTTMQSNEGKVLSTDSKQKMFSSEEKKLTEESSNFQTAVANAKKTI